MNNNRKIAMGLGALALILGVGGVMVETADAYRGNPAVKGPNYTMERHTAMERAFEANDYAAWKNLVKSRGRITEVINKDNFARLAQAHELAENGDLAGAARIRAELGLGLRNGAGRGMNR